MLEMRLAATIQALRTTATGLIEQPMRIWPFFGFSPSFLKKKNVFFVRGPLLRPPF